MTNKEAKQFCIKQIFGEDISGDDQNELFPEFYLKSKVHNTYKVVSDLGNEGFLICGALGYDTILIACRFSYHVQSGCDPHFIFRVYKGNGRFTYQINLSDIGPSSRYRLSKRLTKKLYPYF